MDRMIEAPAVRDESRRHSAVVRGRRRAPLLLPALVVLLAVAMLLNAGIGAVRIAPPQVIAILLDHAGIGIDVSVTPQQDAVLWNIRLPRILLAALVGGALALAGAVLQGVFRNPLADPSLIGVSSGAAVGAVAAIVAGFTLFGLASLPVAAFTGGMLAMLAVYAFARQDGRTEVVTLILTGIAINAIAGAATGIFFFLADDTQLRTIVFWTLGSLGGATWRSVWAVLPFIGAGMLVLPFWGRQLNLLVLGEREARHLGVNTESMRFLLVALAALIAGASVAVAGVIGFVGLVVPHIIRLIAGPDHRLLLPASTLAGAVLLLLADLAARTLVLPRELPLGVVTALAGGPFFLWLLHRTRREHGGWG
ncbi:MAG: FecCD family ABC transporter permease [Dehalococcoidia bacterium]